MQYQQLFLYSVFSSECASSSVKAPVTTPSKKVVTSQQQYPAWQTYTVSAAANVFLCEQQVHKEVGQSSMLHIRLSCACRAGADLASSFKGPMRQPDVGRC